MKKSKRSSGIYSLATIGTVGLVVALFITIGLVQRQQTIQSQAQKTRETPFRVDKRVTLFGIPQEVMPEDDLYAVWAYKSANKNPDSWIGLFEQDADDASPIETKLLSECSPLTPDKRKRLESGICTFTLPDDAEAGLLEFRLFSKGGDSTTQTDATAPTGKAGKKSGATKAISKSNTIEVTTGEEEEITGTPDEESTEEVPEDELTPTETITPEDE